MSSSWPKDWEAEVICWALGGSWNLWGERRPYQVPGYFVCFRSPHCSGGLTNAAPTAHFLWRKVGSYFGGS
jgi:hypothetical protein